MRSLIGKLTDVRIGKRTAMSVVSIVLCVLIGISANITMLAGLDFSSRVTGATFACQEENISATATVQGEMRQDAQLKLNRVSSDSNDYIALNKYIERDQSSVALLAFEPEFVAPDGSEVDIKSSQASYVLSGELVNSASVAYDKAVKQLTVASGKEDVIVKAYQLGDDGKVSDLGTVEASKSEFDNNMTVNAETKGTIMLVAVKNPAATADGNAVFTVQYYGYIDDFDFSEHTAKNGLNASCYTGVHSNQMYIEAFDTSARYSGETGLPYATKTKKTLPKNGQNNHRIVYGLETVDSPTPNFNVNSNYPKYYTSKLHKNTLHQLYLDQQFNSAMYKRSGDVNLLANSKSYYPTSIEVYDGNTKRRTLEICNKDKTSQELSTDGLFEQIKADANGYVFTTDINKDNTFVEGNLGPKYIYVSNTTTIKFLFDEIKDDEAKMSSTMYDYDITDGSVYSTTTGTNTTKNSWYTLPGTRYIYTERSGINSVGNYESQYNIGVEGNVSSTKKSLFGFGNFNVHTGLSDDVEGNRNTLNGYLFNRYNNDGGRKNSGCTFGLITGFDSNLNPIFADGIDAPQIFGQSKILGKTIYNDVDLVFRKTGDCHVLSSVRSDSYPNISAKNLEYFAVPKGNTAVDNLTNNFFPLDNMVNNDDQHDVKFGQTNSSGNVITTRKSKGTVYNNSTKKFETYYESLPGSDDRADHNSYFGMSYQIKFTLADNYTGPLNYLFYGDDDMWVFLDDQLICDIGGIHSSVGEYVNLWEYINEAGAPPTGTKDSFVTTSTTHTLTFFYTERGASGSCCYMRYTLPAVMSVPTDNIDSSSLKVEKKVEDPGLKIIQEKNKLKYTINYGTAGAGTGTITAKTVVGNNEKPITSGDIVLKDTLVRFTITPGSDSDFTKLTRNNLPVAISDNADVVANDNGSFTYTMTVGGEENDITVLSTFTPKNATKYTVTFGINTAESRGASGTITAKVDGSPIDTGDKVIAEKQAVFTVVPNATSVVKEIRVDGAAIALENNEAVTKTDENYTYTATIDHNTEVMVVFTKATAQDVDPNELLTKNIYLNVRNIKDSNPEYYAWVWGYDDLGKFREHFQKMELANTPADSFLNNDDIYVLKLNYVRGQRVPSNFLFTRVNPDRANVIDDLIADPDQDVLNGWGDHDINNGIIWNKTYDYVNYIDFDGTGSQPNYFETEFHDYTGQTQLLYMDWKYQGNISENSAYLSDVTKYYFDLSEASVSNTKFFAYIWSDEYDNRTADSQKWAENDVKWVELTNPTNGYYSLDLRAGTNFIIARTFANSNVDASSVTWDNIDWQTENLRTDTLGNRYTIRTTDNEKIGSKYKLTAEKGYINKDVYLDMSAVDTGDVDFYAYADGRWIKLTSVNSDYYTFKGRVGKSGIIVRVPEGYNPSTGDINNPNILNKSEEFTIQLDKNLYTVTPESTPIGLATNMFVSYNTIDENSNALQPDVEVLFKIPDSYNNNMEVTNGYYRAWIFDRVGHTNHWERFENINEAYKKLTLRKGDKVIVIRSDSDTLEWTGEKWRWRRIQGGTDGESACLVYDGTTTFYNLSGTSNEFIAGEAPASNSNELKPGVYFGEYKVGLFKVAKGTSITVYDNYQNNIVVGEPKSVSSSKDCYVIFKEIKKDGNGDVWGRFNYWWQMSGTRTYNPDTYSYQNVWTKIATYNKNTNQTTKIFEFVKNNLPSLGKYRITNTSLYLYDAPNTPYTYRKQITSAVDFYVTAIDACINADYDSTGRPIWGYGMTSDGYVGWYNFNTNNATYSGGGSATTTYTGDTFYTYQEEDLPSNSIYVATKQLQVYDSINGTPLSGNGSTITKEFMFYVKKTKLDSDGNVWGNFDFYYKTTDDTGTVNDCRRNVWVQLASAYYGGYAVVAPATGRITQPIIGATYKMSGGNYNIRQGPYYAKVTPNKTGTKNNDYVVEDCAVRYREYGLDSNINYWIKSTYDNGVVGWTEFSGVGSTNFTFVSNTSTTTDWNLSDFPANKAYTANTEMTVYDSTNDYTAYTTNGTVANGYNIYINKVKKDAQGYIWGRLDFYYATSNGTSNDVQEEAWVQLATPYSSTANAQLYTVPSELKVPKAGKTYQLNVESMAPYHGPSTIYTVDNDTENQVTEGGAITAETVNVKYDAGTNGIEYWIGCYGESSIVYYPKYEGSYNAIFYVLQDMGIDNSTSHRKEIAIKNGISDYGGSIEQNTALVNLLKAGQCINPDVSSGGASMLWYKFSQYTTEGDTSVTNYWSNAVENTPDVSDYPAGVYRLKTTREIYKDYKNELQFSPHNKVAKNSYIYIRQVVQDENTHEIWGRFNYWYETSGTTATSKDVNKNAWVKLAEGTGATYARYISLEDSSAANVPYLGYYSVIEASSAVSLVQGPNFNGNTAVYKTVSSSAKITNGDEVIVSDYELQYSQTDILWMAYVETDGGNGFVSDRYMDYNRDASAPDLNYYKNHIGAYRLKCNMPIYTDPDTLSQSDLHNSSYNTVAAQHYIYIREAKKDKKGNIWGRFNYWYLTKGSSSAGTKTGTAQDVNANVWVMLEENRGENIPGKVNAVFIEEAPATGLYTFNSNNAIRVGPNYRDTSTYDPYKTNSSVAAAGQKIVSDFEIQYYSDRKYWAYKVEAGFIYHGNVVSFDGTGDRVHASDFRPGAYKLNMDNMSIYKDYITKSTDGISNSYRTLTKGYYVYLRNFEEDNNGNVWAQFNYWYICGKNNTGKASSVYRDVWVQISEYDSGHNISLIKAIRYDSEIPKTGIYTVKSAYAGYSLRSGPNYRGTVTETDSETGEETQVLYYNYNINCYLPSAGTQVGVSDFEVRYQSSLVWMYYTTCSNGEGFAHNDYLTYYGQATAPKLEDYPAGAYKITANANIYSNYKDLTEFDSNSSVTAGKYIYVRRTVMDSDGDIWGRFNFWYVTSGSDGTENNVNRNAWIKIAKNNGENQIGTFYASLQSTNIPATGEYKNINTTTDEETQETSYSSVALRKGPNYINSSNPCYARNGYAGVKEVVVVDDVDVRYGSSSLIWSLHATAKAGTGWQHRDLFQLVKAYSVAQSDVYKATQNREVYANYTDAEPTSHVLTEGYNVYIKDFAVDDNQNKWAKIDFWYKTGTGNSGKAIDVLKDCWVLYSDADDNDFFESASSTIPKTGSYSALANLPVYAGPSANSYKSMSATVSASSTVDVRNVAVEYAPGTAVWWGYVTVNGVSGWIKLDSSKITNEFSNIERLFTNAGDDVVMGLDVSHHQGDGINFKKARALGYEFVMLRAGYAGTNNRLVVDTCFYQNYVKAKRAGLKVGLYWYGYSYYESTGDISTTEAQYLIKILEDEEDAGFESLKEYIARTASDLDVSFEYPIFYDFEEGTSYKDWIDNKGKTKKDLTDAVLNFCKYMSEHGQKYYCGVYTYKHTADNYFNLSTVSAQYPVWYARYPSDLNDPSSYVNFNTTKYPKNSWCPSYTGMWQFTSKGDPSLFITGKNKNSGLDVDVSYVDYETYIRDLELNGLKPLEAPPEEEEPETPTPGEGENPPEIIQPDTDTLVNDTTNFPFVINFYGDEEYQNQMNGIYTYRKYSASGKLSGGGELNNGGTFYLRNGEYIIFDELPSGIYFVVTESENQNYITSTKGATRYISDYSEEKPVNLDNEASKLGELSESTSFANHIEAKSQAEVTFTNTLAYRYKIVYDYQSRLDGRVYYVLTGVFTDDELKDNIPDLSPRFVEKKTPYVNNFFDTISWDLPNMTTAYDDEHRLASATVTSHNDERTSDLTVLNVTEFGTANSEESNHWNPTRSFTNTLTLKYASSAAKRDIGDYKEAVVRRGDKDKASFGNNDDWLFTTPRRISILNGDDKNVLTYYFSHWEVYNCKLDAGLDVKFTTQNGLYVLDRYKDNLITKVFSTNYNYVAYDDYYVVPIYVRSGNVINPSTAGADTTISLLDYSRNQFTYSETAGNNNLTGTITDRLFADVALMYSYNDLVFNNDYGADVNPEGSDAIIENIKVGIALEVCGDFKTDSSGKLITSLGSYEKDNDYVTTEADVNAIAQVIKSNAVTVTATEAQITNGRYNCSKGTQRNILNYNLNKNSLNNKNRLEYYLGFKNNAAVRNRLLKAYSYIIYKENGVDQIKLSETPIVFLNYYDIGTKTNLIYQVTSE